MNWQATTVSMLDCMQSKEPRTVTLSAWIAATKRSNIDTPKRQRPALMPHGYFVGGRTSNHCRAESSVVQFDIDLKDNPRLDCDAVKQRCASLREVLFCAKSASGGLWGLMKRHGDLDAQLMKLEQTLNVQLDKANSRSVAALRFASYDPEPYEQHI